MMELPFNLNNPFRGKMKSMEYNGYWNPNRNDKQEKQKSLIINLILRHSQWNNEQKSVVLPDKYQTRKSYLKWKVGLIQIS